MSECIKCMRDGMGHPGWCDDGTDSDLSPFMEGGPNGPPRHLSDEEEGET